MKKKIGLKSVVFFITTGDKKLTSEIANLRKTRSLIPINQSQVTTIQGSRQEDLQLLSVLQTGYSSAFSLQIPSDGVL